MPALNRSDRLANDLGPLYMKSLAEKLTGSDVIDNYALEQLYGHLKEVFQFYRFFHFIFY